MASYLKAVYLYALEVRETRARYKNVQRCRQVSPSPTFESSGNDEVDLLTKRAYTQLSGGLECR